MNAPLWESRSAAQATGGRVTAPFQVTGVSIDSRTVQKGDLFVAISGPHHDGHDHVATAFASGAAAAMVSRPPVAALADRPFLVVNDTLQALEALGRQARSRSRARVATITGSVGKTSTKEALRLALDVGGRPNQPTHFSPASFNNHIGVPLTLARLPADAEYAVFEIGMNHAHEITPLVRLVHPDIAIVTNVEAVHTENFPDGIDGVARAKAEIFDGFDTHGRGSAAILNRDSRFFDVLAERARKHGVQSIIGFGAHEAADYRLITFAPEPTASTVTAELRGRRITYRIGAPGRHWAMNTLAVLAAVESFGIDAQAAAAAFEQLSAPKGRGQRHRVPLSGGSFELIDDSYNASPVSMRASFEVLKAATPGTGGRRIAVLGDMLELGPLSPELHEGLADPLVQAGIDLVFTCGTNMARLHKALPPQMRGGHAPSSDILLPAVQAELHSGDVVVVKGSLGSRMGRIVDALLTGAGSNGNGNGNRPNGRVANG